MELLTCPNCGIPVIPTKEGTCPSCCRAFRDVGDDPESPTESTPVSEADPYRSPAHESSERSARRWLFPVTGGTVCVAGVLLLGLQGLQIAGVSVALGSCFWLIVRGAKDGAFSDPILFVTGVSLIAYVVGRWDRAKLPILFCLGGFAAMIAANLLASS